MNGRGYIPTLTRQRHRSETDPMEARRRLTLAVLNCELLKAHATIRGTMAARGLWCLLGPVSQPATCNLQPATFTSPPA